MFSVRYVLQRHLASRRHGWVAGLKTNQQAAETKRHFDSSGNKWMTEFVFWRQEVRPSRHAQISLSVRDIQGTVTFFLLFIPKHTPYQITHRSPTLSNVLRHILNWDFSTLILSYFSWYILEVLFFTLTCNFRNYHYNCLFFCCRL